MELIHKLLHIIYIVLTECLQRVLLGSKTMVQARGVATSGLHNELYLARTNTLYCLCCLNENNIYT